MDIEALLDTDSIVEAAEIGAGVSGLTHDALRARVGALTANLRDNGPISAGRATATRRQITQLLIRRLSIKADIQRRPEILEEQVEAPIFVVGFGRTGTSLLQCLLGTAPGNRLARVWQIREPSPPPGEMPVAVQRIRNASNDVERYLERCPGLLALHPYWDGLAHAVVEDEEIMALDFHYPYPSMLYDAPTLPTLDAMKEPVLGYRFLKEFMQYHQWNRPKKRWVMKGVIHQSQLQELFTVFPDATCLWPHREPADFLPSTLAIIGAVYVGITASTLDRKAVGPLYMEGFKQQIARIVADPAINDPRVLHMTFDQVAKAPLDVIRAICTHCALPYSPEFEAAMKAWLDDPANRSDRYRRHKYEFEPFGVDWAGDGPAFEGYRHRFLTGEKIS